MNFLRRKSFRQRMGYILGGDPLIKGYAGWIDIMKWQDYFEIRRRLSSGITCSFQSEVLNG